MTDERLLTTEDIDRRIDELRTKERDLKLENMRISNAIKALRPELYTLVALKKSISATSKDGALDAT